MYIRNDEDGEEPEMKEIKVKIPVDFHWRLHTLKLTSGTNISETVRSALCGYFEEIFESKEEKAEA